METMPVLKSCTPFKHKKVDFLGFELDVPEWATHVAADGDGSIFAYNIKPVVLENQRTWDSYFEYEYDYVGIAEFASSDSWKHTLVEV